MLYIELLILQTCFFSISKKGQKSLPLYEKDSSTFYCLHSGPYKVFCLLRKIVCKIPDQRDILQKIKLVHNVIISRLGKQKVTSTLDALVRPLHARGWEINTTKIHRPATCVRLLEFQQRKMSQIGHLRDRTDHCTLHHQHQEAQRSMGLLILEAAFTEFRNTAPTCLLSNSEGCPSSGAQRKRKCISNFRSLKSYANEEPIVLEVSLICKDLKMLRITGKP